MGKEVGLSRNLKLRWMNKAAQLCNDGLSAEEYKAQLNEYLSFEISSPTNLRKTREILIRIWNNPGDEKRSELRTQALQLINKYPEFDVEIQWCMLLLAYPVFVDISRFIGRMSEFSETILLKQLKQKLFDEWGERTTLYHSTDKIIATIKDLGLLTCQTPGNYTIPKRTVVKEEVALFMLQVSMMVDGGSYYSFEDLQNMVVLFPFQINLSKEAIANSKCFTLSTFNSNTNISLSV